ncbi:hypothetical protein PMAYCL1PPCAC_15757, partial [Pristionchus mayeri]
LEAEVSRVSDVASNCSMDWRSGEVVHVGTQIVRSRLELEAHSTGNSRLDRDSLTGRESFNSLSHSFDSSAGLVSNDHGITNGERTD